MKLAAMTHHSSWIAIFGIGLLIVACQTLSAAPVIEWTRQFGTTGTDQSVGVGADSQGNLFVAGRTSGSQETTSLGGFDIFLRKYDVAGELQWAKQVGTSSNDQGWDVTIDSLGNSYVSGDTEGALGGNSNGGLDAFISKFDPAGTLLWTEQFGGGSHDQALQISVDGLGNIFAAGQTQGKAFINKFDATGSLSWTREVATIFDDVAWGVAAEGSGNVYVTGESRDDVFLRKYSSNGDLLWSREIATSTYERAHSVSVDGLGNVFIAGNTSAILGEMNFGRFDGFLAKYDSEGTLQWIEQLGTSENDNAAGVSADGFGNVYVTGFTLGVFPSATAGSRDFYVAKYNSSGEQLWLQQLGTTNLELSTAIATGTLGNIYVAGDTFGDLAGTNAGGADAFLMKLTDLPESNHGDFDGDGSVGGHDFLSWQRGETADPLSPFELMEWSANYGARHIPLVANTSVPEPACCGLLVLAGIAIVLDRLAFRFPAP